MNKQFTTKIMCTLVCTGLLFSTLTACGTQNGAAKQVSANEKSTETTESSTAAPIETNEHTRAYYSEQMSTLEKQYNEQPTNRQAAVDYAEALFALGAFDQAEEIVDTLLTEDASDPQALYLSARLNSLNGRYDRAEKLYNALREDYADSYGQKAESGLLVVYYQTNQYRKTRNLSVDEEDPNKALLDMMQSFDEDPYKIDWNGKEQTSIPFTVTEPLPVIPIVVNGVKINAVIDTGGSSLVIDKEKAAELGVEAVSQSTETFAGGNTADIELGKAESLQMGGVDITNVPVMLGPFDGFSDAIPTANNIHAIIGTNILQQFIPTMDYLTGELVLRPRNAAGLNQLKEEQKTETIAEKMPFTLANTHFMFAKGAINGYDNLNMFVDSGLSADDGAGMILPEETMDLVGIPMPELTDAVGGGMGGSDFQDASYDVDSYGLGDLQLKNGRGFYFTGDALDMFEETGFITDALISHNYLKQYKWTIDFDAMAMTFST